MQVDPSLDSGPEVTIQPLQRRPVWPLRAARGALKLAKIALAIVVGSAGLGVVYELVASTLDARQYPPPGELHDLGGYRLHLNCRGQGSPTVLLEAGLGRDSLDWSWVQPELARHTRTCSYDRAGAGWSDPGPLPRDAHNIASELHSLLVAAGIRERLVLVGHSAGGSFVQLYEHLYPASVAGMVLVDVTHRENPLQKPPPGVMVALAKALRFTGFLRLFGLLDGKDLPAEFQAAENTLVYRPHLISTLVAENEAVVATSRQVRDIGVAGSLGDLPLVILTAAGPFEQQPRPPGMTLEEAHLDLDLRHRLQREMLGLSSRSYQVMAEHSGHQIHKDQPELVIEVITDLLGQLRPLTELQTVTGTTDP
ncbi:MAG: alpha/beta hydrolase [Acidobacteriota bacterium]